MMRVLLIKHTMIITLVLEQNIELYMLKLSKSIGQMIIAICFFFNNYQQVMMFIHNMFELIPSQIMLAKKDTRDR